MVQTFQMTVFPYLVALAGYWERPGFDAQAAHGIQPSGWQCKCNAL